MKIITTQPEVAATAHDTTPLSVTHTSLCRRPIIASSSSSSHKSVQDSERPGSDSDKRGHKWRHVQAVMAYYQALRKIKRFDEIEGDGNAASLSIVILYWVFVYHFQLMCYLSVFRISRMVLYDWLLCSYCDYCVYSSFTMNNSTLYSCCLLGNHTSVWFNVCYNFMHPDLLI